MGGFLTKEAILGADDINTVEMYIPEWNGKVRIRTLKSVEKDRLEVSMVMANGRPAGGAVLGNIRARFAVASLVLETGEPQFTEAEIPALGEKSAAPLARIFNVVQELSAVSDADVEEMAKNFGRGRPGFSATGSPATSESGTSES